VGFLMRQAVQVCRDGRFADRNIKFGICGEHGGDPASVSYEMMQADPPFDRHEGAVITGSCLRTTDV
jgi:hypothetical protein